MSSNVKSAWTEFTDLNAAYLADLFDRYQADPSSVDPNTRSFFESWGPPPSPIRETGDGHVVEAPSPDCDRISGLRALSTAIRMYGHHGARIYPLGKEPVGDTELLPEAHGLRNGDLDRLPASVVGGEAARRARNAREAIEALRRVYQSTSGYEFEHISNAEERRWLFDAVESGRFRPPEYPVDERWLLERLTQVEAFERFLQSSFPAQSRFSIEGLDMLVPMLDELIAAAAASGTHSVLLGMAHRGRLNVLAQVLGKPYEQIIAEFRGAYQRPDIAASGTGSLGWTGDVKYHLGAGMSYNGSNSSRMLVIVPPNPSHLEFIDPVVEGMTRAASEHRDGRGPAQLDEDTALAVLLHGDASFPGQGVVAETFNLSRLQGYRTGGTVHIITNNQLGFTTLPEMGRSTLFASDLAKGFEVPIVHVNADDPEACVAAIRLAHAYVRRFHKDYLVDLIGYRRWGHNEGDEPSFTQPVMYGIISKHPRVRELWAQEVVRRGLLTAEEAATMLKDATERLFAARRASQQQATPVVTEEAEPAGLEAGGAIGGLGHAGPAGEVSTAVPMGELVELNQQLFSVPNGFHLHPKLEPFMSRRRAALATSGEEGEQGKVDWAHAEALAFASILAEGTPIRLTGEDSSRGTFSQRHLVLYDASSGESFVPLQHASSARAAFDVWDSPLSEQSTLGFEFGYDVQAAEALVLWEAQYGDFVNGAQVLIDAFLTSARSKWGLRVGLVMLLPHGYEGQGPEHSSARLERFLQMAGEDNMRVANCSTAAQYFHILRRQALLLSRDPRPLVLLTPKSLLRHPLAASPVRELAEGSFQPVLDDSSAREDPGAIKRLILCSGKVHVDLESRRTAEGAPEGSVPVAVVRVEELYPFPVADIKRVIDGYPNLEEVAWVQEEPRNMGGWNYVAPRLRDLMEPKLRLMYGGRTRRASPAEGSLEWHVREQKRLVDSAFSPLP